MNKQTIITTIGIIAILALIALGISYSQNIIPKQNYLLPVANQAEDALQNEQGLQNQIDDLMRQLSQLQNDDVAPFGRTTYTNDQYGFSFNYPADYRVEETYPGLADVQISLVNDDLMPKSFLVLYINPDGFGPIWVNIRYNLSYVGNQLHISERITQACEFCDDNNIDGISASISVNGVSYFFNAIYPRSGSFQEQMLKDMISSFRSF